MMDPCLKDPYKRMLNQYNVRTVEISFLANFCQLKEVIKGDNGIIKSTLTENIT